MSAMNPKVDGYLRKSGQWREELGALRRIVLECGLTEEVKWRVPCYTFEGRNVVILGRFKEYCAFGFMKGALLKDPEGVLEKPGENTQSARVIRFRDLGRIDEMEGVLKEYVREAVEVERAGLKVEFKKAGEFAVPEEFQARLDRSAALRKAFKSLTPGRQRAYLLYFGGAKRSKTREGRVEKCVGRILEGKGLED